MLFILYNQDGEKNSTFRSIYDLERYIDAIRESRGERYPRTEKMSCFDYIKFMGWSMEIVPVAELSTRPA